MYGQVGSVGGGQPSPGWSHAGRPLQQRLRVAEPGEVVVPESPVRGQPGRRLRGERVEAGGGPCHRNPDLGRRAPGKLCDDAGREMRVPAVEDRRAGSADDRGDRVDVAGEVEGGPHLLHALPGFLGDLADRAPLVPRRPVTGDPPGVPAAEVVQDTVVGGLRHQSSRCGWPTDGPGRPAESVVDTTTPRGRGGPRATAVCVTAVCGRERHATPAILPRVGSAAYRPSGDTRARRRGCVGTPAR